MSPKLHRNSPKLSGTGRRTIRHKINDYNGEVLNWDFKKEQLPDFLKLLTERNIFIQEQTPITDFHNEYNTLSRNNAVVNHQNIKEISQISFHVGSPHQRRLYSLLDDETGNSCNEGVFFSLEHRDISYYSGFGKEPLSMVYFLDISKARDVRVQTKYDSSVISRYDLDDIMDESQEEKCSLKIIHRKLNREWIDKNTISFNFTQISSLRKKGYDWLIVPDPINVKY